MHASKMNIIWITMLKKQTVKIITMMNKINFLDKYHDEQKDVKINAMIKKKNITKNTVIIQKKPISHNAN